MPLPPGLTLNRQTGVVSGVPTTPGTYGYGLVVRDAQGSTKITPVTHVVHPYDAPVMSGTPSQFATRTVAYSAQFTLVGGLAPFTWSVASGTLPTGLSLSGSGLLAGTPTEVGGYTDRALVIRAVDDLGSATQFPFTMRYRDLMGSSATPYPPAYQNNPYNNLPDFWGGHEPIAFALTSGSMPAGLTFNTATGRISGTPASIGTASITVQATDVDGETHSWTQDFVVNAEYTPVSITGSMTGTTKTYQRASGSEVIAPTSTLGATGGAGTITFSWARISGSTKLTAASPTSPSTGFNSSADPGESVSALFRMTATDGTSIATYDVTITGNNTYVFPALTSSPPTHAMRTVLYSGSFTLTGGKAPYTYTLVSGTLPTGITLNASTGVISGTPTDTSYTDRTITVRVTDAESQQASGTYTMQYANVLTITGSPSAAYELLSYNWTPTIAGGFPPRTVTVSSGSLPAGLSLNSGTGQITGTPSTAGTSSFTLRVEDSDSNVATLPTSITVSAYVPVSITGALAGMATRTRAYSSAMGSSGGLAPYTYSIASGSLPPGLSLNSSTGAVTGTPSSTSYGNYSCTIMVTDGVGNSSTSGSQAIAYRDVPTMTGRAFTRRRRTEAISESVATGANAHTPVTYSVVSGSMPTGASLNTSTGLISGTLTGTSYGNFSITIRATAADGSTSDGTYTLAYANVVSISVSTPTEAEVGRSFSSTASGAGGFGPYTFSISSGTAITGTSLNSSTGAISGTVGGGSGTANYTLRVTDADGAWAQQAISVTVYAALSISGHWGGGALSVGSSVSVTGIAAAGGKTPYTYSVASGSLPAGLSLNPSTGAITGTPTTPQSYSFTLRATDALGYSVTTSTISGTVASSLSAYADPPSVFLVRGSAGPLAQGVAIHASGGSGGYTYSSTWLSGGSGIGISGASSNTPSVSATASPPTQLSGVVRTVVTDSASNTVNVDWSVDMSWEV